MPKKTSPSEVVPSAERLEARFPGLVEVLRTLPNCEVGRRFGFSRERARQIRQKLGVPPVNTPEWNRVRRSEQLRAMPGADASAIGEATGLSKASIRKLSKELDIVIPPARANMPANTPEQIEAKYPGITQMLNGERGALRRVSETYGVSYTHVSRLRNRLAEHGLVPKDWEAAERASVIRRQEWAAWRAIQATQEGT